MRRYLLAMVVTLATVTLSFAQDKDIAWSFDKRLTKIEDKVAALERQVAALKGEPKETVIAQTGPFVLGTTPVTLPLQPVEKRFGAPSQKMQMMGISWFDITNFVEHLANLLESHGPLALAIVRNGLKMVEAITDRDLSQIIKLTMTFNVDIRELIAAVKAEFGIPNRAAILPPPASAASGVVVQGESVGGRIMSGDGPIRSIFRARPVRSLLARLLGR